MNRLVNGRLVKLTAEEISAREAEEAAYRVKRETREALAAETKKREQALNELIDERLKVTR